MIRARGISVHRPVPGTPGIRALSDVDLDVGQGEFLAVLGRPGAGKTTLLEALAGLLPLHGGAVELGRGTAGCAWKAGDAQPPRVERVGFLFQFPERQLFGNTALEDVSWGLDEVGGRVAGRGALLRAGIPEHLHEVPLRRLSRGEKRRVALAGVLVRGPGLLFLDEPTVGLDAAGRDLLWAEVEEVRNTGKVTVLVATHWAEHVLPLASTVLCLEGGKPLFFGDRAEFLRVAGSRGTLRELLPFPERLWARLNEARGGDSDRNAWQRVALECLRDVPRYGDEPGSLRPKRSPGR